MPPIVLWAFVEALAGASGLKPLPAVSPHELRWPQALITGRFYVTARRGCFRALLETAI
jgi:hypothetical protein